MLSTPFEDLDVKRQHRGPGKDKTVDALGYDTETIDGLCRLLADEHEYIHPKSFEDCAEFLTRPKHQNTTGFFYNLRYDFQAILKWLPPSYWQELQDTGQTSYGKFDIDYIPKKMFKLRRHVHRQKKSTKKYVSRFYDISQFYGKMGLDAAARKYLTLSGKSDLEGIDVTHLDEFTIYDETVITYCIRDAFLCGALARHFIDVCKSMEIAPTNFCSPASIASKYFIQKTSVPTINRLIKYPNLLRLPWAACSGAFINVYKRGFFDTVYEYDINSAYPFVMRELPHLDDGQIVERAGDPPPDASMGWIKVEIDIPHDTYCPPLPILRSSMCNYFPWGLFTTVITLKEFHAYSAVFRVRPIKGVYFIPEAGFVPERPFKEVVDRLYAKKQEVKGIDDNVYSFCKIALNGFYGKFLERHKVKDPSAKNFGRYETGNFFLPFYGSYILAGTRLKVWECLQAIPENALISANTDAVFTTKPLNLDTGPDLGKWDLASKGEGLFVGCGIYAIRTPTKTKQKTRGFKTNTIREDEKSLFDYFKEQRRRKHVTLPIKINHTFGNVLRTHTEEKMNLIECVDKDIYINFDTKRLWQTEVKNAGFLLENQIDSFALPYGVFK
jgi:hypothetical protein